MRRLHSDFATERVHIPALEESIFVYCDSRSTRDLLRRVNTLTLALYHLWSVCALPQVAEYLGSDDRLAHVSLSCTGLLRASWEFFTVTRTLYEHWRDIASLEAERSYWEGNRMEQDAIVDDVRNDRLRESILRDQFWPTRRTRSEGSWSAASS